MGAGMEGGSCQVCVGITMPSSPGRVPWDFASCKVLVSVCSAWRGDGIDPSDSPWLQDAAPVIPCKSTCNPNLTALPIGS